MILEQNGPVTTALAPMRNVTTRAFCDLFLHCGEPDLYVTEFLRAHATSTIERNIEEILVNRRSTRPIFVQLLGREPAELIRVAGLLSSYNIRGIDLNFGCPMAKIYRKDVGGALLKKPWVMDEILSEMEKNVRIPLSVKIRTGFGDDATFEQIIGILAQHNLAHVTVHARTVCALYREKVNFERVKFAKSVLKCKVFANGDINSAQQACDVAKWTHCDGVMIGRAAIRNPFIFRQIRELQANLPCFVPKFRDIHAYILRLVDAVEKTGSNGKKQVNSLKKYFNFIGQCVDSHGEFLHRIRRSTSKSEMFATIDSCIGRNADEDFCGIPRGNIIARPNCE
ncbi:MAG: tRNA-dihydrouridine synthase family protein [Puniceicoccales bacterium]|jgi:nifR3 family TIM-barrel protein|nr:tRNA-dihydrouridine synthase family protein [Puniceicoccales bacterium]